MCAICGLDEILFVFVITKTLKQIHVLSVSFFAVQRNECLERKIEQLAKGVTHESMDVRQVALSKLRSLLHNNQTTAQAHSDGRKGPPSYCQPYQHDTTNA